LCAFGAPAAPNRHPDPERDIARDVRQEDEQAPPELGLRKQIGLAADLDPRQVDEAHQAQPEDVRDSLEEKEGQHADLRREDTRRVTIRAKLYAAIVMTILGPVITIGVAFAAFQSLSDRFDEVSARSDRQALALELKYAVTDVNGWQTAYGYDDGASRPQFERSAQNVRRLLAEAQRTLTEPRERAILARLRTSFDAFMALDVVAYRALQAGQDRRVKQIFLGPEIRNFEAMAAAAGQLAAEEQRRNDEVERAFDQRLTDAKKSLVVVGLGAGVLIVLLLLTASDIARLALEQQASREP
jgi:hypothetical protein